MSRGRAIFVFVAAQAALAARTRCAHAQSPQRAGVVLDWQAPAECPDRAHVVAEIDRLIGGGERAENAPHIDARAIVESTAPDHWQLRLDTVSSSGWGSRTIDGRTCVEVADATALILALAINPDAGRVAPSAAPSSAPLSDSASSPPMNATASGAPSSSPVPIRSWDDVSTETIDVPAHRASTRERPWRIAVRTAVALDVGTFAAPATGLDFAAAFLLPRWRFELNAAYWFPQYVAFPRAPIYSGEGADISMVEAGARVCFSPIELRVFDLGACGRFELGSMTGAGQNLPFPSTGSALWAAAMLGLSVGLTPSRWVSFRGFLDTGPTLLAPTFEAAGFGQLHRPGPWIFRGSLGIEFHF